MMRFIKKLLLFCIFVACYHNNAITASAPYNKPSGFAATIDSYPEFYEAGIFEELHQEDAKMYDEMGLESRYTKPNIVYAEPHAIKLSVMEPTYQRPTPSRGLGCIEVHAMNPVRKHGLRQHCEHKPTGPTIYKKMQVSGNKTALTAALKDLEEKLAQRRWPWLTGIGLKQKIKEIKELLNSPFTDYLHSIRTDDLALAKEKIEYLGLEIYQRGYRNPVYIETYQAAKDIYIERCNQAIAQQKDEEKQAAITHDKKVSLEAAAAQKLAVKKEIELTKQQLLEQVEKTVCPLESEKLYEQITNLEELSHDLLNSDSLHDQQMQPEVDQKVACEVADEQGSIDRMHLEQEKQALLEQAERAIDPFESEELYCQADLIEANIQAFAQENAASNDNPLMAIESGVILGDSALTASKYAYQFDAMLTNACQNNPTVNAEVDQKVVQEAFGFNDYAPIVMHDDIALGNRSSVAAARDFEHQFDLVLTHAYLDNCTIDPEFNNKIVRAICEGLQEAGYAFGSRALDPRAALETYKEIGESALSLAKAAFYLTVGREIYVLSDGKYCLSDAQLREHINQVVKAIKEIDPFAFSAKQSGEFVGSEAAKVVHTIGLSKILGWVSKVNMASKAQALVSKLDKITHTAQAEKAVAVTAEGFVVQAANEARVGLALSEINNASQAEKRVVQAAAGLAQEEAIEPAERAVLNAGERIAAEKFAGTFAKQFALLDDSLGDLVNIEKAAEAVKNLAGSLEKDGPLTKLLVCGQRGKKLGELNTARGAAYEIETTYSLMQQGEKILEVGAKIPLQCKKTGKTIKVLEVDIKSTNKLIECKAWDWSNIDPKRLEKLKSDLPELKILASNENKAFEFHSKYPLPDSLKTWLQKHNILFFED